MEILKMTENEVSKKNHKTIAMGFLNDANSKMENPVSEDLVVSVYDLFANEKYEAKNYQTTLQKIITK